MTSLPLHPSESISKLDNGFHCLELQTELQVGVLKASKTMKKSKASKPIDSRKTEKYTPNTKWLLSLLASKGFEQRELATQAKMAQPALSKAIHGKRRITLSEVTRLAPLLSVPLEDLINAFGMKLDMPLNDRFIEVEGWFDGTLTLQARASGLRGSKTVPCPFPDRDIRAARVQSAGTEFDGLDGALIYYRQTRSQARGVDVSEVGRLGLVKIAGDSECRLRVLRRGYAAGKFNLTSLAGKMMEESVSIESVWPVIWLKI